VKEKTMESMETLKRLAGMLRLRKQYQHRPYLLLLTSSISFTPDVRTRVCRSERWDDFQAYVRGLGASESIHVLMHVLQTNRRSAGYQALAHLITQGYFSLLLTANVDSFLEDALREAGCQPLVLIVDGHNDRYIAASLENQSYDICILKLHGSLREGVLPTAFPSPPQVPAMLQDTIRRALRQDLIVVGSLAQEHDIARLLTRNEGNSLYYVLSTEPEPYDEIARAIEARGYTLDERLISGPYGTFDHFFCTLEKLLAEESEPSRADPPVRPIDGRQRTRADILLVTATDIETRAMLACFPRYTRQISFGQVYYDLGFVQHARVFLVQQAAMGSSCPGGSLLTTSEGIRALLPSAVIMVGIAFGVDRTQYEIGDILISQSLLTYEQLRVGSDPAGAPVFLSRGLRPTASIRLLGLFQSAARDWQGARVACGLFLSGEKLVDHMAYRDQLLALAPEAIGGEMEGAGLYAAAHTYKVDWILVKAICDWADGQKGVNKRQNQQRAAENAARFTAYVLILGGFVDGIS
jgi:nucleoside phosphorylase